MNFWRHFLNFGESKWGVIPMSEFDAGSEIDEQAQLAPPVGEIDEQAQLAPSYKL